MKYLQHQCKCMRVLFAAAATTMATSTLMGAVSYTVQDLGTLPGDAASAVANGGGQLNNLGQVVGFSQTPAFKFAAVRTAPNGAITSSSNLGNLGGNNNKGYGINALGQAVGIASNGSGGVAFNHAFRTTPTGLVSDAGADLGTLGGTFSAGYGINLSGQTVGTSTLVTGTNSHAFRSTPSGVSVALTDLGTLGGTTSTAYAINDSGQTVGDSLTGVSTNDHAFRTAANGAIDTTTDLGAIGPGRFSNAYQINASGQTVGSSSYGSGGSQPYEAFRTTATGLISDPGAPLGFVGGGSYSRAFGINTTGEVVGTAYDVNFNQLAVVDNFDGNGLVDLNTLIAPGSGLTLTFAYSVNDSGQIVGIANNTAGAQNIFLLTPVAVPEPVAVPLVGGAFALLARRRNKKVASVA